MPGVEATGNARLTAIAAVAPPPLHDSMCVSRSATHVVKVGDDVGGDVGVQLGGVGVVYSPRPVW